MEDQWLTYAKRLQAIAATGLHFTGEDYDRERYEEVDEIATEMMAHLADRPVTQLAGLLPRPSEGYANPRIDVRAAVFRNDGLLMCKEKTDDLWSMPGGYADVGHSAGENVVKEVWEETGLRVSATRIYAVLHKARRPYPPDVRDFYKLFFLCETRDDAPPVPGPEVHEVGFFSRHDVPPLSVGRVSDEDIALAFQVLENPDLPLVFD